MWAADFEKLSTTADYEAIIRDRVSGVPEHWIADIAQQCLHASPSPQGRRHAPCTNPCMPGTCTLHPQSMGLTHAVTDIAPCNCIYLTKQAKSGSLCAVQAKPNVATGAQRVHTAAAVNVICCYKTAL